MDISSLPISYAHIALIALSVAGGTAFLTNRVTYKMVGVLMVVCIFASLIFPDAPDSLGIRAGIASLIFLIGMGLRFAKVGMGGGVVLAACLVAIWMPLPDLFDVLVMGLIAGGAWALVSMFLRYYDVGVLYDGMVPLAAIFLSVAVFSIFNSNVLNVEKTPTMIIEVPSLRR